MIKKEQIKKNILSILANGQALTRGEIRQKLGNINDKKAKDNFFRCMLGLRYEGYVAIISPNSSKPGTPLVGRAKRQATQFRITEMGRKRIADIEARRQAGLRMLAEKFR